MLQVEEGWVVDELYEGMRLFPRLNASVGSDSDRTDIIIMMMMMMMRKKKMTKIELKWATKMTLTEFQRTSCR